MANESAIEVVARWIEEGGPGVNLASTRRLMADTVRNLAAPAASAKDGGVLMPDGLRRYPPSVAQQPYGVVIKALADLLTAARTDEQCDADVQPSDSVRAAVQTIRIALDEIMTHVPKVDFAAFPTKDGAGKAVAWRDMATAPKDGTLLRLLVNFEHHATEDGEGPQATIGSNTYDNHHDFDECQFAGWNWEQDCYTQGVGTPVGWLPMMDVEPQQNASKRAQATFVEISGLLSSMLSEAREHVRGPDEDVVGYTVRTGALHKIFRLLAVHKPVIIPSNLPRAHETITGILTGTSDATAAPSPQTETMQPVAMVNGVVRFKENLIVSALYREAEGRGIDIDGLARGDFTDEDRMQFAQLIGYSVSGYGGLPYVTKQSSAAADKAADAALKGVKPQPAATRDLTMNL